MIFFAVSITFGICVILTGILLYIKDNKFTCLDNEHAWTWFIAFGITVIIHALIYLFSPGYIQ